MTPQQFINTYYPHAYKAQQASGISAMALLAQSALETGWGKAVPGNMMFGIKAGSSWKGAKQLVTTTEIHKTNTVKYPQIISITKRADGTYRYVVKDWFRSYNTAFDSFMDHISLIQNNPRYKKAFDSRANVQAYFYELAKAGYATDPTYFDKMMDMVASVQKQVSSWAKDNPKLAAGVGLGMVALVFTVFFCSVTINHLNLIS